MTHRHSATLIEVLVAIFVMGIGLIALLTLFPLGALRMAQSIQDDHCATAGQNAIAIATMKNIRNDPLVRTPPFLTPFNLDVFKDKLVGTKPGYPPLNDRPLPADPNGPSYPVLVDPIGYVNTSGATNRWVAANSANAKGRIARSPSSIVGLPVNTSLLYKWFTLLDDYFFNSDETIGGQPHDFNPPRKVIRRDIRYSWAYLVQRPRSSDPSIATCSVVVYKRPLTTAPAESLYNATFDLSRNVISVDWGGNFPLPAPNVNTGDWILDCTFIQSGPFGTVHGFFYRVVGITQTGPRSANYEVQQPIRGFTPTPDPRGGPANYVISAAPGILPSIMVLEGVVDVYERGLDRKFD